MRCFLALDLPPSVRFAVEHDLKHHHEKLDRQGLRWTRAEKLHITLGFLGEVEPEPLFPIIRDIVSRFGQAILTTTDLGGFPDLDRPGVLYMGVQESTDILAGLHLEFANTFDLKLEDPFQPHITLAQMKPASKPFGRILRGHIKMYPHQQPEEVMLPVTWQADTVTLFESKPDGAYRLIETFPLSK